MTLKQVKKSSIDKYTEGRAFPAVFILMVLNLFSACGGNEENGLKVETEQVILSFPIATGFANFYDQGENSSIFSLQYPEKKIVRYAYPEWKVMDTIDFSVFPGDLIAAYWIGNDSIIFIDRYKHDNYSSYHVYLTDWSGRSLKKWNQPPEIYQKEPFGIIDEHIYAPCYKKGLLYIHGMIYISGKEAEMCHETVLDLRGDDIFQIRNDFPRFPPVYHNGKNYGDLAYNFQSRIVIDKYLYYSYPIDHNIYQYSLEGKLIRQFDAKSAFISEFDVLSGAADFQGSMEMFTYSPYYYGLTYDPYREIIYRFSCHSMQKDDNSLKQPNFRDKEWSVIIFDKNFHKLGEINLSGYLNRNYFLLPDGLMLFKEKNEQGKYVYDIVKISQ